MTIYCTATGPLTSTLTWTKDHLTLQPSNRIKYDVNGTCSALTIRMTKKADSGNYTCNVRLAITNEYNKYLNKLIGICSGAFHCFLNCIGSCEESPVPFSLAICLLCCSHSRAHLQKTVFVRVFELPTVQIRPFVRTLYEGKSCREQCKKSAFKYLFSVMTEKLKPIWSESLYILKRFERKLWSFFI